MHCTSCGSELPKQGRFCANCGSESRPDSQETMAKVGQGLSAVGCVLTLFVTVPIVLFLIYVFFAS